MKRDKPESKKRNTKVTPPAHARVSSKKREDSSPFPSPVQFTIDLEKRRSFFNSLIERDKQDTEKYIYGERQRLPRVAVSPPRPKDMRRKKTTAKHTSPVLTKEVEWSDTIQGHSLDKTLYNGHVRIDLEQFRQGLTPLFENSEASGEGDEKLDSCLSLYEDDDYDYSGSEKKFTPKDYTYNIYPGGDNKEEHELIVESRGDCFELIPREMRQRSIVVENATLMWVGDTSSTDMTVEDVLRPQQQRLIQQQQRLIQQQQQQQQQVTPLTSVKQNVPKKQNKKQTQAVPKNVKPKKTSSREGDSNTLKEPKEVSKGGSRTTVNKSAKGSMKKQNDKSSSSKSKGVNSAPVDEVSSPKTKKKPVPKKSSSSGCEKTKSSKKIVKKSGTPVTTTTTISGRSS